MTREQALEALKMEQAEGDTETAHYNADEILCEFIATLGFADVVAEYHKVSKWYA